MKNLIVANWKCNPTSKKEAKNLFEAIRKIGKRAKNVVVVVCPPYVFISELARLSAKALSVGGQNVFWEERGAYTGEISPEMLRSSGADYVILGHSERRKYFAESNEQINKKIKKSLSVGLKVIFCVGEMAVLEAQLREGLNGISRENVKNISIAYEPVWAIGTGNNCPVEETMSSVLLVRKIISEIYNREIADKLNVLYGGSVKSENSGAYMKETGANGLLVGGASLNAEEFEKIVKSAYN